MILLQAAESFILEKNIIVTIKDAEATKDIDPVPTGMKTIAMI
jgi:hypothetical protein